MKLIPNIFRQLSTLCLLMVILLSSCAKDAATGDRRAELLSALPDDAVMTVALSPAAILKSAGMEATADGIKLSKSIERLVASNSSLNKVVGFITSAKGIDYDAAVVAGGITNGYVLFALSDVDKFCAWAKDNDMEVTKDGSYTVCYKDIQTPAIVIDGLTAWFIGSAADEEKAVSIVENNKSAAAKNKIAQWKIDRLMKADVNAIVNIEAYGKEMSSAFAMLGLPSLPNLYASNCKYTAGDINFDGATVRMTGEAYDEAGKSTTMFAEGSFSPIPSSTLALVKDSQFALGGSLPDAFTDMISNMVAMYNLDKQLSDCFTQCFRSLKSMAIGVSTRDGMSIANFKPSDISATIAIGYDKTEAEKAVALLTPIAKNYGIGEDLAECWNSWTGKTSFDFSPYPQLPDFKIYLTGKDDIAFISTDAKISEVKLSNDPSLEGLLSYLSIDIKKSHPLLTLAGCPFGIDAHMTATNEKSEGYLTLTETDTPILESLITLISRNL
ncbi:MAG: hypothetical protein K2J10_08270 [Muribaculaceae bacterium]|nr:hypothetical protein [Muribaculaceae bacterium]